MVRIPTLGASIRRQRAHGRRVGGRSAFSLAGAARALPLVGALLSVASPAAAAPTTLRAPAVDRRVNVAFGVAAQLGVTGTTGAWADTLAERVEFSGEVGGRSRTAFGVELTHARPELRDAGVLVTGGDVGADTITGWRDELGLQFVVRVPVDVGAVFPSVHPVLRLFPTFGVSGGFFATDAHLDVPGFDARVAARSRAITPLFGARVGLEARVWEWMSLVPYGEFALTYAPNAREQTGGQEWGVEGRMLVGADAVVRF